MSLVLNLLLCTLAVMVPVLIFPKVQPSLESYPVGTPRWLRQAIITTGGSAIVLLPYMLQRVA